MRALRWWVVVSLVACDDGGSDTGVADGTAGQLDGAADRVMTGPPDGFGDAAVPPDAQPDMRRDAAPTGCIPLCPAGQSCVNDQCEPTPCATQIDCPPGFLCDGVCRPGCTTDGDCGGNSRICENGACIDGCDSPLDCPATGRCVGGRCAPCLGDTDCVPGQFCEVAAGRCTDGCRAGECPDGQICAAGRCVGCVDDAGCGAGAYCDATGACIDGCLDDTHCAPGQVCTGNECIDPCLPDAHEPDDDPITASMPALPARIDDHSLCPRDRDLYAVVLDDARLSVELTWGDVADLTVRLLDANGQALRAADDPRFTWPPAEQAPFTGLVIVEVAGEVAGRTPYTLTLDSAVDACALDARDPQDDRTETATPVPGGDGRFDDGRICPGDVDWFGLDLERTDGLEVVLTSRGGPLALVLGPPADPMQVRIDAANPIQDGELLRFFVDPGGYDFAPGPWVIGVVARNDPTTADYTLQVRRTRPTCDPALCPPAEPCRAPTCTPDGGCVLTPREDGTPCPDANLCNGLEICGGGVCTGGDALDCATGVDACQTTGCDPAVGCTRIPRPDGSACSDGQLCNGEETCREGFCLAGSPPSCPGSACTTGVCDPAQNACVELPVPDNTPCPDADTCNGDEVCRQGQCIGGPPTPCPAGDACQVPTCDPVAGCGLAPAPDGTGCADDDRCNGEETCRAGRCEPGAPLECLDTACRDAGCDPSVGCVFTPIADGTPCQDGSACNGDEVCRGGECVAGPPLVCPAGGPCQTVSCDPTLGCQVVPGPDGVGCSDGNACNGAEICQGGQCVGGSPPACGASDACMERGCDPAGGCFERPINQGQTCADDGNVCTDQVCDAGRCVVVNVDRGCDDGTVCNGVNACRGGQCVAVQGPPGCGASDACMERGCDAAGGCFERPINQGQICSDDGNVCTDQVCDAGRCVVVPVDRGCDDGNVCNGVNACRGGQCVQVQGAPNCGGPDACNARGCDPAGGCFSFPVNDGGICGEDGNVCTNDVCRGGACVRENNGNGCDDGDPCTIGDVCGGGACRGAPDPNWPALDPGGVLANDIDAPGQAYYCDGDERRDIDFCLRTPAAVNLSLGTRVNGRGWYNCPGTSNRCDSACANNGDPECTCQTRERVCGVAFNPQAGQGPQNGVFFGCSNETNPSNADPPRGSCDYLAPDRAEHVQNLGAGRHRMRVLHTCNDLLNGPRGANVNSVTTESVRLRVFRVSR